MAWRPFDGRFRDGSPFASPLIAAASAMEGEARERDHALEEGCSYSRTVRQRCFLDKNSDGKPVKKCEKTEQIMKHCIGKPQEIVESKSECSEEDAPDGWAFGSFLDEETDAGPFSSFPFRTPSLPGMPGESPSGSDHAMDPFSRALSGGIESFMQAAEEMMNEVFNQMGFYRRDEGIDADSRRSRKRIPSEQKQWKQEECSSPKSSKKVDFSDLAKDFDEV